MLNPYQASILQIYEEIKRGNKYVVPNYQRDYCWKVDDHCKHFIEDIFNIVFNDIESHFFNSMVFIKDSNMEIVDGQQRLITALLFLKAKQNLFGDMAEYIKEDSFKFNNIYNQAKPEVIDLYTFFLNPKGLSGQSEYGYEYKGFKKTINNELLQDNGIHKILTYCFENTCKEFEYLQNIYFSNKTLIDDTCKYKKLSELIEYKKAWDEIYRDASFTNDQQSLLLFFISIVYCLKNNIVNSRDIFTESFNEATLRVAVSCYLVLTKREDTFDKIKDNWEQFSQRFKENFYRWIGDCISILNNFLQFFSKIEVIFEVNKKNRRECFVDNFRYIHEDLAYKYSYFIESLINEHKNLNDCIEYKPTSMNPLSNLFNQKLENALKCSLFVIVEVSHSDPTKARQLALDTFASINSTGEPLEAFDIVCSDLYGGTSPEKSPTILKEFLKRNNEKIPLKKDDVLLKFYFAACNRNYKKNKLYLQFKDWIRNRNQVINAYDEFIDILTDFCRVIYNIDNGIILQDGDIECNYSSALHLLGKYAKKINTLYPPLYLILKHLTLTHDDKKEIFQIFWWHLIISIICLGGSTKNLTNDFEKLMKLFKSDSPPSKLDILYTIKDEVFKVDVTTLQRHLVNNLTDPKKNFYNEIGRQIIIIFEGYKRKKETDFASVFQLNSIEFNLIDDAEIEHISPQSKESEFDKHNIGNFTLLNRFLNASAQASDYSKKIGYHLKSGLLVSAEIILHHIEKYNQEHPDDKTEIGCIVAKEGKTKKNKITIATEIKSKKDNPISELIKLDTAWLVGKFDNLDVTLGEHLNEIISVLCNSNNEVYDAFKQLELNPNCSCSTINDYKKLE